MATFSGNFNKIMEAVNQKIRDDIPPLLAGTVRNFVLENFEKEAWQGETEQPWAKRKDTQNTKKILIASGEGKESMKLHIQEYKAIISIGGGDFSYMKYHNSGSNETTTQNVKAFTRKIKKGKHRGKEQNVKAFTRTVRHNLPKRQFIGRSPVLIQELKEIATEELNKLNK
ncbi:hypothetical protein [Capnocytophaga cynodegmi]|uniref:Phage virion morphogenesis protein n=1 Tax=Capnocytophaga cynodegmi TaxID=28189 RepID=A0A0B7HJB8_9FLAO|nr:hypothetical protein [Capnocytophaga cynodegmi]CEN39350.1 conserved hypothetical protein [Capnocytophaga cynodegmi]CEN41726.1 conserved hypothetical protein [Capnocytophaga cynodegmi]